MERINNIIRNQNTNLKAAALLLIILSGSAFAAGQINAGTKGQDPVYDKADKMPLFEGKDAGEFSNWVANQIKYPEEAVKQKIIGSVSISFIVEKDGSVTNVKVVKGVPVLNEEAIRAVSGSPKWTPGIKNGETVRVSFVVPVNFRMTFPSDEKLRIKG